MLFHVKFFREIPTLSNAANTATLVFWSCIYVKSDIVYCTRLKPGSDAAEPDSQRGRSEVAPRAPPPRRRTAGHQPVWERRRPWTRSAGTNPPDRPDTQIGSAIIAGIILRAGGHDRLHSEINRLIRCFFRTVLGTHRLSSYLAVSDYKLNKTGIVTPFCHNQQNSIFRYATLHKTPEISREKLAHKLKLTFATSKQI